MSTVPRSCKSKTTTACQVKVNWNKVNKSDYRHAVYDNTKPISDISTQDELQIKTEGLIHSLKVAANSCVNGNRKSKVSKKGLKIWTPAIAKAVADSKAAHREWKEAGSPSNPKDPTSTNRKVAKARMRSAIRSYARDLRVEKYNRIAIERSEDTKLFFNLINQQRGGHRGSTDELHMNGKTFNTPEQIAEAFGFYFRGLANPDNNPAFSQQYKTDAECCRAWISDICSTDDDTVDPITTEEMHDVIQSLSNGKAADSHGLSAEHLKFGGEIIVDHLTNIVNFIFNNGIIPDMLKSGIVTPVLKKGKEPSSPTNYGGITVTSIIMKVIEKA